MKEVISHALQKALIVFHDLPGSFPTPSSNLSTTSSTNLSSSSSSSLSSSSACTLFSSMWWTQSCSFLMRSCTLLTSTVKASYEYFIIHPLAKLYLWGPSLGGWGFLGGQELSQVCAEYTKISAQFWDNHPRECLDLISRQFYSLLVSVETFIYFFILLQVLKLMIKKIKRT